jgi:AcrR family transcriptional regulator
MAAYKPPRGRRPKPGPKAKPGPTPRARKSYHHGNLSAALIQAALQLVQEAGPQGVTVREAARRAGVSSGAPFRHFPSRRALMTAVGDHVMAQFRAAIAAALSAAPTDDPVARIRAMGHGYIRWALRHPAQYQVIAAFDLVDFEGSADLKRGDAEIRAAFAAEVDAALARGLIGGGTSADIQVICRALVHGLARMQVDAIFLRWGVAAGQEQRVCFAALDLFLQGLRLAGRRSPVKD